MVDVSSSKLRNNTRALLVRVAAGESITIAATAMALVVPVAKQDDDYVDVPGLGVIRV